MLLKFYLLPGFLLKGEGEFMGFQDYVEYLHMQLICPHSTVSIAIKHDTVTFINSRLDRAYSRLDTAEFYT